MVSNVSDPSKYNVENIDPELAKRIIYISNLESSITEDDVNFIFLSVCTPV